MVFSDYREGDNSSLGEFFNSIKFESSRGKHIPGCSRSRSLYDSMVNDHHTEQGKKNYNETEIPTHGCLPQGHLRMDMPYNRQDEQDFVGRPQNPNHTIILYELNIYIVWEAYLATGLRIQFELLTSTSI